MGDGQETTPLLSSRVVLPRNSSLLPWDPSRARKSGIYILVSVTLERLAYYTVLMNLYLYLNKGQAEISWWDPIHALTAVFVINGVSYLSAPFGGWLSDGWISRYWAIIVGKVFYILGFVLLTALSVNKLGPLGCDLKRNEVGGTFSISEILQNEAPCSVHVYVILVLIGLGVGCLRANVPPFGAEQVRASGRNSVQVFFTSYYWCINIGSLVGIGVLGYIQQDVEQGFFISYVVATISLVISLITFAVGRLFYVVQTPSHSVISSICGILAEGLNANCRKDQSIQGSPVIGRRNTIVSATPSWIDRAKVSYGGSYHDVTVDDVKKLSVTLLFLLLLIPFWLVYFQMSTSFQAQGLHMRVTVSLHSEAQFTVPAVWLTLFDQLFVLALVPALNYVIYPLFERRNYLVSFQTRIALGMSLSFLAVLGAAVLEHFRLETWSAGGRITENISGTVYNASDVSVFWQVPQYCLIGAAEVFAGVAGLEYAYSTTSRPFQGILMGLYSALEGIGSFAGILLVYIIRSINRQWIADEEHFNEGHMDYYFYVLAVIQAVALLILLLTMYLRWRASISSNEQRQLSCEDPLVASALHSEYAGSPQA